MSTSARYGSKATASTLIADRPETFQIKGGLFPMQLLDLRSADLRSIFAELKAKVLKSPAFFNHSPIVFGFEQLTDDEQDQLNLQELCILCRQLGLIPLATRGGNPRIQGASNALGIAVLPKGRAKPSDLEPLFDEPKAAQESKPIEEPAEVKSSPAPVQTPLKPAPTKVVSTPIRSGQQIYAAGGDLIILSAVSAGAEVLADGNIHIYGPLRGRALAGVQGDENARIFCSSQEAELVSVAGQFLVDETLRSKRWKQAVQIYLSAGQLTIDPLS